MTEPLPATAPAPVDPNSELKAYSPTGEKITILAKDAAQLESAGGKVATVRDFQQEKLDAVPLAAKAAHLAMGDAGFWATGGFTPEGETFTRGVASGATMGLSDLAGKGVGKAVGGDKLATQYRDTANAFDAESPLAAKAGEATGMIAGTIAGGAMGGGGLGLGKAGLALPSAGIGALGTATENAVARMTAGMLARGALGRAGSTALQFAARGAVEGAMMEGAHATTDALFQDHDLAAEKILMAAGKGGLSGFAIGGVLGGGGSLLASGVRKLGGLAALRGVAGSVAERTEGAISRELGDAEGVVARKAETPIADALNDARVTRNAAAADAGTGLEKVERGAGELATAAEKKAGSGMLEGLAHGQAADALGANQRLVQQAAESLHVNPDQARKAVGKFVLDRGLIKAGDTSADVLVSAQDLKSRTGKLIGEVFKDRPGSSIHMDDVYSDGKAAADSLRRADNFGAAEKIEQYVANMERGAIFRGEITNTQMEHTLENFVEARRRLSKQAYEIGRTDPALERALKDLDRRFESRITQKLEEAGKKAGTPELKNTYESLKKDYQMASIVEDWASHGTKAASANRKFGLTDTIMTVGGLMAAGPVGATLGVANMIARGRGNATAAVALSRMAQRNAVDAAHHTFDDLVSRAAGGFLKTAGKDTAAEGYIARNAARNAERGYSSGAARNAAKSGESLEAKARTAIADVKRVAGDEATFKARSDEALGDMRHTAPLLAAASERTMARAVQFLASKVPEETKNYAPLSAPTRKPSINPVQAAQFLRYKEAVENPQGALERMSRGEMRREDVETLRVVAPKAFETIQIRVLQRLTQAQEKGVVIPHEQRLKLSLLLDIKGDATLEPGTLRVLQKNVSAPVPSGKDGGNGPQQGAPKRPVQIAGTQLTGTDKLEAS